MARDFGPTIKLQDFPDEILVSIVEHLADAPHALSASASTCARLSALVDIVIYRKLLIRTNSHAESVLAAVCRRPGRASYIRQLTLAPVLQDSHKIAELLLSVPRSLLVLQDLTVELPFYLHVDWDLDSRRSFRNRFCAAFANVSLTTPFLKPRAPLQSLRSCQLNYQNPDGEPFPLGDHGIVLLHPNLLSLTLTTFTIDGEDLYFLRHYRRRTPLTHLHLDNWDVSASGFESILATPTALESLKFQEYNYDGSIKHGFRVANDVLRALASQRESLKELHISFRGELGLAGQFLDLQGLSALLYLRFECTTSNLDSDAGRAETLAGLRPGEVVQRLNSTSLRQLLHSTPNLSTLVLQTAPGFRLDISDRAEIERIGKELETPGLQLVIERVTKQINAVPPYLFGEEVPQHVICYDSLAGTVHSWDAKSEYEVRIEQKVKNLQSLTLRSNLDGSDDFMLGQLNSA